MLSALTRGVWEHDPPQEIFEFTSFEMYGILTYNVTFNYLKECKSLHVGCVAKHGRQATRNYYLLCNSLLFQIVDCSSSCAPYSRFSTDCVTFLKMYFLPGKLGHMFVDL